MKILKFIKFMILGVALLMSASTAEAQNFTAQNGQVADVEGETMAIFDMFTKNKDVTDVKIGMRKKYLKDFTGILTKCSPKAKEWAATAQREGVTDFTKEITHKYTFMGYLYFKADGMAYGKKYSNGAFVSPQTMLCSPHFFVDKDGNTFVRMFCRINEIKVSDGKSVETTTTVKSGSILAPHSSVAQATSREFTTYNLDTIDIYIPTDELDDFVEHLEDLAKQMEDVKAEKKSKDNLFK